MRYLATRLTGLIYLFSSAAIATESHCNAQEQVVFSCSTGTKLVSVCASKDLSATRGYLQYRFGVSSKPELLFPSSTQTILPRTNIQARTLMFAGGGGGYLRFINGHYNYIVYSAIGQGWGAKDGIAVEKDGKVMANLLCKEVPVSILSEDFFGKAGLSNDQKEFELP
ncbi:MAG: hypothetical protein RIQ94_1975 [Pseudomonadota bacterium]|jgi:hypothetical protein